jgi:hypothetical protein
MAAWDTSMPLNMTDGDIVDELDIDPVLNNVNTLRYATVFQGGQRRTTDQGGITGTANAVVTTPATTLEAGQLYEIKGVMKWRSSATDVDTPEIQIRQGTILGSLLLSFAAPRAQIANAGYSSTFSVYIKNTVLTAGVIFTLSLRRLSGTGSLTCDSTSWMAVLRSGDNALMTDV